MISLLQKNHKPCQFIFLSFHLFSNLIQECEIFNFKPLFLRFLILLAIERTGFFLFFVLFIVIFNLKGVANHTFNWQITSLNIHKLNLHVKLFLLFSCQLFGEYIKHLLTWIVLDYLFNYFLCFTCCFFIL